jgi:hypothetical protein
MSKRGSWSRRPYCYRFCSLYLSCAPSPHTRSQTIPNTYLPILYVQAVDEPFRCSHAHPVSSGAALLTNGFLPSRKLRKDDFEPVFHSGPYLDLCAVHATGFFTRINCEPLTAGRQPLVEQGNGRPERMTRCVRHSRPNASNGFGLEPRA